MSDVIITNGSSFHTVVNTDSAALRNGKKIIFCCLVKGEKRYVIMLLQASDWLAY